MRRGDLARIACWMLVCSALACSSGDGAGGDAGRGDAARPGPSPDARTADRGVDRDARATTADARGTAADNGLATTTLCAPLPAATGRIVRVEQSQAAELPRIVAAATSGTTIVLGDGTYRMTGGELERRLIFRVPGVTLRSASGDRTKVVLDGEYATSEVIAIVASDVMIAELTVQRAAAHLVHITGAAGGDIQRPVLYGLRLVDSREQFVKVNSDGAGHFADHGRLECSQLELTAAGRPRIQPNPGGCYTGGIDAHGARGWQVRGNTFTGIHCANGSLAEHAVHFWSASRDTLVERNLILDCARGVGFGLDETGADRAYADHPYPGAGYLGHIDGVIRNNVIHASAAAAPYFDTGIELGQARSVRVYHNTVVSRPTYSSIDARWSHTRAELRNNLTYRITTRNEAVVSADHNLQDTPAGLFQRAAAADYHLLASASAALDQGVSVPEAGLDLDGRPHSAGPPDLGAYERPR